MGKVGSHLVAAHASMSGDGFLGGGPLRSSCRGEVRVSVLQNGFLSEGSLRSRPGREVHANISEKWAHEGTCVGHGQAGSLTTTYRIQHST